MNFLAAKKHPHSRTRTTITPTIIIIIRVLNKSPKKEERLEHFKTFLMQNVSDTLLDNVSNLVVGCIILSRRDKLTITSHFIIVEG